MGPLVTAPAFRIKADGRMLPADLSGLVKGLAITKEVDAIAHGRLTLANPYPRLPWTKDALAGPFRIGGRIEVEMGYVDDLRLKLTAEITAIEADFAEDGASTISVEGHSALHRLRSDWHPPRGVDPPATVKDTVETIARTFGLKAQVANAPMAVTGLSGENRTALAFLQACARQFGYELMCEDTTLVFRRPQLNAAPACTLAWGATLRSFRPRVDVLGPVGKVTVRAWDPVAKQAVEATAGPGDEDKVMGKTSGGKAAVAMASGGRKRLLTDIPGLSREQAADHARRIYNRHAMEYVTATGSTVGKPEIVAGTVIGLAGLGSELDGPYYVTHATHRIDENGYLTFFSVKRNALS